MQEKQGFCLLLIGFFSIVVINNIPNQALAGEFGDDVLSVGDTNRTYLGGGAKVGSFVIHPELTAEESYNDNIYAVQTGKAGDSITDAKPAVVATSDWGNHALNFFASGDLGRYARYTSENFNDYDVASNGRLDITRGNYLWGGIDYSKSHEARGTPDDLNNGVKPVVYTETVGQLGFTHDVSRISATVGTEVRDFNYSNGSTSGGTVIEQDARNRLEYGTGIRLAYEIIPGYKAFIKGTGNIVSYENKALLNNRNSYGFSADTGTAIEITGKLKGEIYVGYLDQEYDNSAYRAVSGFDGGGKLTWNVTGLTKIEAGGLRSINETLYLQAYSFIDTSVFCSIEHDLTRDVKLLARAGYDDYQYEGINQDDRVYLLSTGARYLINKNIMLKADYSYGQRDSNVPNNNYQQNIIIVGASIAL